MRRLVAVLALAGCGGGEALMRPEPPAPPPPPPPAPAYVRALIGDGPADIFDRWPVVIGGDTVVSTRTGDVQLEVERDAPLTVHVALEAVERRYWSADAYGYRNTAYGHSGLLSILDTVAVAAGSHTALGDTVAVELRHRRDFGLWFWLNVGPQGQAGHEVVIEDAASGAVLERVVTDSRGEALVRLSHSPHVFQADSLVSRWDLTGLECGRGAGVRRIPIGRYVEQFHTGNLVGKRYGAACELAP
ncbi:hypothetical protein [Candidatus Palauibacter sp.]|uniref:hypothetical protein n=1 Tax=Candidatus Palauibacter sp. TaxID=3101350 RepID=UPI003B016C2B